jgi:hypothetical protein
MPHMPHPPHHPELRPDTREQLLHLLAEASEFEHNLLCSYLFAAYSLRAPDDPTLAPNEREAVERWRRAIIGVAVEEMTHLALVANLTAALGARPHFDRPNFPVEPGYHPACIVVALAPFDADTIDHFVFLERPQQSATGEFDDGFEQPAAPPRGDRPGIGLMPSAVDYATTAGFYSAIRETLVQACERVGEPALFAGDPAAQVGPEILDAPGLRKVTDLRSALAAIDTIVLQGEGAPRDHDASHFQQFLSIRDEYHQLRAARPGFEPAHPVARNPVMRKPVRQGRAHIDDARAAAVLDVANALYNGMIRLLSQAWGQPLRGPDDRRRLLDTAIGLMRVCALVAQHLATLPASPSLPGLNAGISFTTLRATSPWMAGASERLLLRERLLELDDGLRALAVREPALQPASEALARVVVDF